MTAKNITASFTVDQTPQEAFDAINNVRGWWSGNIEGNTDELGGEFVYRYQDIHYSRQRIAELVPGKRVVWEVLDSYLSFVKDKTEWNGTRITFEISKKGGKTQVRFTHKGLVSACECFGDCSDAWGFYVRESLRKLITIAEGIPNPSESTATAETK
jgi:Activator of Hsp90 ATPase homolog 1-like protein